MAEKSFLDSLVGAWRSNLEADDYDEDVSDELLATIEEVSPETYKKIAGEYGM